MVEATALLLTALLFGGMTLFAAGFAGVLYQSLPKPTVGKVLRETFPRFYGFVIAAAAVSAAMLWFRDGLGATALAGIAVTAVGARQVLTPAINRATDSGQTRRFNWLHGAAVTLTLGHILAAGWVVVRFLD